MVVEVRQVLGQCSLEVPTVENQYPAQQFVADGADPTFGDRVCPGCPHGPCGGVLFAGVKPIFRRGLRRSDALARERVAVSWKTGGITGTALHECSVADPYAAG